MTHAETIEDRAEDVVEEFELFDDWMGRYEHLIEIGRGLAPMDERFRTELYKVRGCQSQVWLGAEKNDQGLLHFEADSDAMITKGLVALLLRVLNDQPASEVAAADLSFLDRIGMKDHLSSTRKNGLDAMIKRMKAYAEAEQ